MSFSPCRVARRSLPFVLLAAGSLALAAWIPVRAQEPAASELLEHSMEQMNGALKALLKGIDASNRDKSLANLAKLQAGVVAAKAETPPMAATLEESKRPEFVAGFRRKLVEVLATSCRIETAILDGNYDDANKLVKDELTRLKKEGHDTYQEEQEE